MEPLSISAMWLRHAVYMDSLRITGPSGYTGTSIRLKLELNGANLIGMECFNDGDSIGWAFNPITCGSCNHIY